MNKQVIDPLEMIQQRKHQLLRRWLNEGGDPNAANPNSSSKTPLLHLAVEIRNQPAIHLLLQAGADIEARNNFGMTPLSNAVLCNHTAAIKILIRSGANPETKNKWHLNAMETAIHYGKGDAILALFDLGVDIKDKEKNNTGLWSNTWRPRSCKRLIDLGFDFKEPDEDGRNGLWHMVYHGNTNVCKRMISMGVDINHPDMNGITPLMVAVNNDQAEIFQLLMEAGAKTDTKNQEDKTALDMARETGNQKILAVVAMKNRKTLQAQAISRKAAKSNAPRM